MEYAGRGNICKGVATGSAETGNIVVPFVAGVNSPEMKTLESPFQSPVTLTSKYGTHDYEIPRVKFDNSLIKDTEKECYSAMCLESIL